VQYRDIDEGKRLTVAYKGVLSMGNYKNVHNDDFCMFSWEEPN
jgi:hypothetical protein